MSRHPLPEPTLRQRLAGLLVIELALLALIVLGGCGDKPTAPANPCIHVDTLWVDGKPAATITAYYSPPCPPKRTP